MRINRSAGLGIVGFLALGGAASTTYADTALTGSSFALNSGGSFNDTSTTFSHNGFVGTYISLPRDEILSLGVTASGEASNGVAPDMTVSVADDKQSFNVASSEKTYQFKTATALPAGTYFVRVQLDNHKTVRVDGKPVDADTTLTIAGMTIAGDATLLNAASDANAIAAANTYIDHFRKGDASVKIDGATAGTKVRVQLASHAFHIGTVVDGFSPQDSQLAANPAPGSNAAYFQEFINGRFNAIEPGNSGKWDSCETLTTVDGVTHSTVHMDVNDEMMAYAAAHGMAARQHNVIWGNQQPKEVVAWLKDAADPKSSTRTESAAKVKAAIANRIAYYIKGTNTVDGHTRAADYQQLDVLNEALQTGNYLSVLGYDGVADVYRQTQAAIAGAGLTTKTYTNEYNVLQNSPITVKPNPEYGKQGICTYGDEYANWYREQIESINNAAIKAGAAGNVVTGIGTQYYPMNHGALGPAVTEKAIQNLSVEGLPISLTEFGGQTSITQEVAPQLVDDAIRMMLGTPGVDSFMYWGWYDDGHANRNPYGGGSTMVHKGWKNADGTWNLTPTGKRFEYLFGRGMDKSAPSAKPDGSNPDPWATDVTATVAADGTIHFNGFYGDYTLTIDGKVYKVSFKKGDAAPMSVSVQ